MATKAQSAVKAGATRTLTWIANVHSHTLHQHSYNHLMRSASSAITEVEIDFYFEGTWARGSKPEYPEKPPDSLPTNRTLALQHWR